jgi:hypothetical protein
MPRASQSKHDFARKDVQSFDDGQHNRALALGRFPSPEPGAGARRGWRFSIINYCNGLVGRVRPAMSAGSPAPAPGPRTNGGGREGAGGGGASSSSRVWRWLAVLAVVRVLCAVCSKLKLKI